MVSDAEPRMIDTTGPLSGSRWRGSPVARGLLLACVLSIAGCAGSPAIPTTPPTSATIVLPTHLRIRTAGTIVVVPTEEYVVGTILSEIAPADEQRDSAAAIYRLQAIIARTYAAFHRGRHAAEGFDLCDATHCQVYQPARIRSSKFASVAREAVAGSRGLVLAYGQRPAEALFHADCGGHTAAAEVVWGGRIPYLLGIADALPERTHRTWRFVLSRGQAAAAVNAGAATAVGGQLRSIRIASRDASGRAATIELTGDRIRTVRGEQLRAAINQHHGALAIQSTRFDLDIDRDRDAFQFAGTGWGHGVGLCQVGAMARLRRGDTVPSVLAAYYPGTRLLRAR